MQQFAKLCGPKKPSEFDSRIFRQFNIGEYMKKFLFAIEFNDYEFHFALEGESISDKKMRKKAADWISSLGDGTVSDSLLLDEREDADYSLSVTIYEVINETKDKEMAFETYDHLVEQNEIWKKKQKEQEEEREKETLERLKSKYEKEQK